MMIVVYIVSLGSFLAWRGAFIGVSWSSSSSSIVGRRFIVVRKWAIGSLSIAADGMYWAQIESYFRVLPPSYLLYCFFCFGLRDGWIKGPDAANPSYPL